MNNNSNDNEGGGGNGTSSAAAQQLVQPIPHHLSSSTSSSFTTTLHQASTSLMTAAGLFLLIVNGSGGLPYSIHLLYNFLILSHNNKVSTVFPLKSISSIELFGKFISLMKNLIRSSFHYCLMLCRKWSFLQRSIF